MKHTRTLGKQLGHAEIIPASFNAEDNTVEVVFATEVAVSRRTWDEPYTEILVCRTPNVRLDRLNIGGSVIDTHMPGSVRNILGAVVRAWVDDVTGEARAILKLSERDEWRGVVGDIQKGIIRNISVGYMIYAFDVDDSNPTIPPTYRAVDWEPTEISFCAVPVDYMSGSRAASSETNSVTIKFTMKRKLSEIADIFTACRAAGLTNEYAETLATGDLSTADALAEIAAKRSATPAPSPTPVTAAERATIQAEERTRITGIRTAARIAGAGLDEFFINGLIEGGITLDNARAQIIDKAAELNPVKPALSAGISVGTDEKDKKTRGMELSILQRAGAVKLAPTDDPGEFRGMRMLDLAGECLAMAGVNVRGMSSREIAVRALSQGSRDGGGMSSGDFSYILQNVLNKTLRQQYDLQDRTFTSWTRKSTATDFKPMLRTQIADLKLVPISEGAEYKYASTSDTGESYKVAKYGRIVNIDWEAIVNDDLDAFSRIPGFLAAAVAQMQGDVVYGILSANANMGDSTALFHAKHGNLAGAGTDINIATLGAGRQAMRQQKSPGGNILNLTPKYIVCGPVKEMVALQYTSVDYTATQQSNINVWRGLMAPIVDARITDTSWYLMADPGKIDTVEYATLDGQDIYTETRYGFEVDALQWKIRTAFGAKAIEWRSMYRNPGA